MPAHAGFVTGKRLKELEERHAKATSDTAATGYTGFVSGVFDMLEGFKVICPDNQVTLGQVNAVVSKYLSSQQDKLNQPAHLLVGNALTAAYPCTAK